MRMKVLPGWDQRLKERAITAPPKTYTYALPKSPHFYAAQLTFVTTEKAAQAMVELAQQRPLSHIGFDTEYGYDRPEVVVKNNKVIHDPKSVHPLLLSLALAEPDQEGKGRLYPFVIDFEKPRGASSSFAASSVTHSFCRAFFKGRTVLPVADGNLRAPNAVGYVGPRKSSNLRPPP